MGMNYRIELAQHKYIPQLPTISKAAAEIFPEEDLPVALRSQTTPIAEFEKAFKE